MLNQLQLMVIQKNRCKKTGMVFKIITVKKFQFRAGIKLVCTFAVNGPPYQQEHLTPTVTLMVVEG